VFIQHGLSVGMLMTAASLCGFWLWWTGAVRRMARLPIWVFVLPLIVTTIFLTSAGALIFLICGIALLVSMRWVRSYLLMTLLICVPIAYVATRAVLRVDTDQIALSIIKENFDAERAQSFQFRLENEKPMTEKSARRPWFGWGGYGRFLIHNPDGTIATVPDSQWIIALGETGVVGVMAFFLMMVPVARALWRVPKELWTHPAVSGVMALSIVLIFYAFDNLMNAMHNPLFFLAMGGLSGVPNFHAVLQESRLRRQRIAIRRMEPLPV
jgi:hypothetical protein